MGGIGPAYGARSGGAGVTDGDKGDVTVSLDGESWTLDHGTVTNDHLVDVLGPSLKGRVSGIGAPSDLTAAQATELLNAFTATLKGLVPAPGTAAGKYLKDDGTWADPPAGGSAVESNNAIVKAGAAIIALTQLYVRSNIIILGDSIIAGAGPSAGRGPGALLAQAIANIYNLGYGVPLHRNVANATWSFTHNGSAGTLGLTKDSVLLNGNTQALTFKPSEGIGVVAYVERPSGTATVMELVVNGVVVATQSIPAGVQAEIFMVLPVGQFWQANDTVQLRPQSGTAVVTGAATLSVGFAEVVGVNTSPLVITAGCSGESFDYFTTNIAQVTAMATGFSGNTSPVYIIALGTNSIYNAGRAQTPAQYVISMQALYNGIMASKPNAVVSFVIPPQADEGTWPVILPGYTYNDYVTAIKASFPAQTLIDWNVTGLAYADGVHPDNYGAAMLAAATLERLGIARTYSLPLTNRTKKLTGASPLILSDGYVTVDRHGVKTLSGAIAPNGTASNLITTLPVEFRPRVVRYAVVALLTTNGFGIIKIDTNGEVRMIHNSTTWTTAYLDGVCFI